MARTDLGEKQVCPNCGAKFYDLRRRPAVCPKCTTSFDPAEEGVRARRTRSRVVANEPALDEDDEEVKARGADDDEEAEEEEAEVDAVEADPVAADEEDEAAPASDELPEGFSEEEADLEDDAADDDAVPLLEDEEEFPEDEIGDLPGDDDEEDGRS